MLKSLANCLNIKHSLNFHFIKVSFFTGTLTLVKMLTGFVSIKVVSVIIGPAGVALLGQLSNFSSIALSISSCGINNGVTKLVAEHTGDKDNIKSIINTGLIITLFCSIIVSLFCILFASAISQHLFFTTDYFYVILIFGFTLVFYALNGLISSIVNGFKEFKLYVIIGTSASVTGLLFTILLVYFWKVPGALVAAVTFQSVVFFVSLFFVRKESWLISIRHLQYNRYCQFFCVKYS
ncbi:MAG: oligosaccharide flippase family protein [Syntrophales bacterium]